MRWQALMTLPLWAALVLTPVAGADLRDIPTPSDPRWGAVLNDGALTERLIAESERLLEAGRTPKISELQDQLSRRRCSVPLVPEGRRADQPAEYAAQQADSVLVVGSLYKCPRCSRWHINAAGGYLISSNGVAVTCRHVIKTTNGVALVAMTRSGRVYPVRAVLTASEANDLAVIQLDGTGFTPVAISTNAPVGSSIFVLSHPDQQYYTLTSGLVSRYARQRHPGGRESTLMNITAEFARGSSGCPVFNDRGAVVGTVVSTQAIYYQSDEHVHDNLQMVLKNCAPSSALLDLLKP